MLKKFFAAILFATIIFIGSQNNSAQAFNIYIGTSGEGSDYYAMTESFGKIGGKNITYEATLMVVTNRGKIEYLDYTMNEGEKVSYTDDAGNTGEITLSETPMVWGLYQYMKKFYGDS